MKPYFDNVLSHYEDIRVLQRGGMSAPRFCTFHTSYKCNHRCQGCAYGGKLDNAMLEYGVHARVLRELLDIGVRAFEFCGGGEPFTLPYLAKLLRVISQEKCAFGALTNGSLFNDELIDLFAQHGTYVRVSLEASTPSAYSGYCGVRETEWYRVLDNIKDLIAAKTSYASDLDVGLKFGVGKSLRGEMHYVQAIATAAQLQVTNVQFKALRHEPEELAAEDLKCEEDTLNAVAVKAGVPIIAALTRKASVPQCWLNPLHTVLDAHGNVHLCCYYYYRSSDFCIGNVYERTFKDLWYSARHSNAIRSIRRDDCAKVDCKFFNHHAVVTGAFVNNRIDFL